MKSRSQGLTQLTSSLKAGFSIRTGRNFENKKPSAPEGPKQRHWKTRTNPLSQIFQTVIEPLLTHSPSLSATMILEYLQEELGAGKYPDSLTRTLQRLVHDWRVHHGPTKLAMFRQTHPPGGTGISDFTQLKDVSVTIQGQPFPHLLYNFRLAYSGWSYMEVIEGGESFAALSTGLPNALHAFGAVPKEHRTDSLSAAYKNREEGEKEDQTTLYEELTKHYGFRASRNNRGLAHENGSIESPHGHIKTRIKNALRRSCDFRSIEEYQRFISSAVHKHNDRNSSNIEEERAAMLSLPNQRAIEYKVLHMKVLSTSTINVTTTIYSVPPQFIGEVVTVHAFHNHLHIYWKGSLRAVPLKITR